MDRKEKAMILISESKKLLKGATPQQKLRILKLLKENMELLRAGKHKQDYDYLPEK